MNIGNVARYVINTLSFSIYSHTLNIGNVATYM